jgi:hypothetical protein
MIDAALNINRTRYPGIKPFTTDENFIFFGRESDINALNNLLLIRQVIVLYGKSGYGKSSLINAGIIPKLKQDETWVYFPVRFNNYSGKDIKQNLTPVQTIGEKLAENVFREQPSVLEKLIPENNSFWYWLKLNQLKNRNANFIIFFDQFEELFTYPIEQIAEFSEQLSELLYTNLPVNYKKRINELEKTNPISDEEYEFLNQKPEVKVIFSIRSDRMSLLNGLKDKHPSILQNSYELDALNIEDAKSAIIEPAKLPQELGFSTPVFTFTSAAVSKILEGIANPEDGKIEAATLQIVCRFVEDTLVKEKKYITITDSELGDITDIFQQYYQGVLDKLTTVEKVQAQKLIEDELIEGNRRNPLSENYIKSKFGISEKLLSILEQSSLLRKERDARGTILYEVSHDSLIGAINKIAENRRKEEDEKKQIELQLEIENEKKRSNELTLLNEKANKRLKLVRLALLFAILAIIATVFFAVDSNNQKEKAQASEKSAKDALDAKKMEEAKGKAKDLLQRGDGFMNSKGFNYQQYALEKYTQALKIMEPYKKDSLYTLIEDNIEKCQK